MEADLSQPGAEQFLVVPTQTLFQLQLGSFGGSGSHQAHSPSCFLQKGTCIPGWREHIFQNFPGVLELDIM